MCGVGGADITFHQVCTTPIERESTQGGESHGLTVDDMATLIKRSKEFLLSHVRDVIGAYNAILD